MAIDLNQKADPEVVKELTKPISFGEIKEQPSYDFEFITQALGLIPINSGDAAIAPGAITSISRDPNSPDGDWLLNLQGNEGYALDDSDMAELEATIRERAEAQRIMQKETLKQNIRAQAEAMAELQGGVAAPSGVIVNPNSRKFRQ
jgi:hypothetical protein